MKILVLSVAILISSAAVAVPRCTNPSYNVSQVFINCINNNFTQLERKYDVNLRFCDHFGNELPQVFMDCVNRNFRMLARRTNKRVRTCVDYGGGASLPTYANCVNRNFSQF